MCVLDKWFYRLHFNIKMKSDFSNVGVLGNYKLIAIFNTSNILDLIGRVMTSIKDIIHGKVNIQIGKNGINEGLIQQIRQQFKKNRYLKIRFLDLHYFENMEEAVNVLATKTDAKITDIRGKTCVLERKSAHY